ncbi:MAG: DUF3209 domain-containing protein [Zetaproteobacteria bacterium]|nr:DUF3209 domain-containing protein [Pseudobdellovibrionaceae bacterium]|tara:strand:- start:640 stop:1011 length:372 start_codon:yes stop_codon:yes gene_type:complete
MACHEVAALRLGLMNVIGIEDEAETQHELNELGDSIATPGALLSMVKATNLKSLKSHYESSLAGLEEKIAKLGMDDPKMPYYQSLLVLTKKVELDLRNQVDSLDRLYSDLDEVHHFLHEVFPS